MIGGSKNCDPDDSQGFLNPLLEIVKVAEKFAAIFPWTLGRLLQSKQRSVQLLRSSLTPSENRCSWARPQSHKIAQNWRPSSPQVQVIPAVPRNPIAQTSHNFRPSAHGAAGPTP